MVVVCFYRFETGMWLDELEFVVLAGAPACFETVRTMCLIGPALNTSAKRELTFYHSLTTSPGRLKAPFIATISHNLKRIHRCSRAASLLLRKGARWPSGLDH